MRRRRTSSVALYVAAKLIKAVGNILVLAEVVETGVNSTHNSCANYDLCTAQSCRQTS